MSISPTNPRFFFPYGDFLAYLEQNGYRLGVDTYLKIQELLYHLGENPDIETLKNVFCPIFATSPEEQERFGYLFDNYFAQFDFLDTQAFKYADINTDKGTLMQGKTPFAIPKKLPFMISAIVMVLLLTVLAMAFITGYRNYKLSDAYYQQYEIKPSEWQKHMYSLRKMFNLAQPCDSLMADFSYSILKRGNTYDLQLNCTKLGNPTRCIWVIDGEKNTNKGWSYQYKNISKGTHTILMEVENAYGCRQSITNVINVEDKKLVSRFSYKIQGKRIQLQDSSVSPTGRPIKSWTWSFGDGSNANVQHPTHTYASPGKYTICLTVNDNTGTESYCQTLNIAGNGNIETLTRNVLEEVAHFAQVPYCENPDNLKLTYQDYLYVPLLLIIIGILIIPISMLVFRYWRRRYLILKEPNTTPPYAWEIPNETKYDFFSRNEWNRVSTALRKREPGEKNRIDIHATLVATLNNGGYPIIQYSYHYRPVEFLVLIDRVCFRDHQAIFYRQLIERFTQEGIFVDIYFHNHHFNYFWRGFDEKPAYLEDLLARHPHHRLLIIGDGEGLIDPYTGALAGAQEDLYGFKHRAFMSTQSTADWGMRETAIAEKYIVTPANLQGFASLLEKFERREGNLREWINGTEPALPDFEHELEIDAIKGYLDEPLFLWLCACAIYPDLHWELTLFLGKFISTQYFAHESKQSDGGYFLLEERKILRLIRIPWFRKGEIPEKIRWQLVKSLSPEQEQALRAALVNMMSEHLPPANSVVADKMRANLLIQKWQMNDRSQETVTEMERLLEKGEVNDYVALEKLKSVPINPRGKTVTLNENFRKAVFRNGIPMQGVKSWIILTIAGLFFIGGIVYLISNLTQTNQSYIEEDGQKYFLKSHNDTVNFFAWRGSKRYNTGLYGDALNDYNQAIAVEPLDPYLYYNRALIYHQLYQKDPVKRDSTFLNASILDIETSALLIPNIHTTSEIVFAQVWGANEGKNGVLSADGKEVFLNNDRQITQWTQKEENVSYLQKGTPFQLKSRIRDIVLAENTTLLATANEDFTSYLFRNSDPSNAQSSFVEEGTLYNSYGHTGSLTSVALSPNSAFAATGSTDKSVGLWNVYNSVFVGKLSQHKDRIAEVNFAPDGESLISASWDSVAIVWDIDNLRPLQILNGHESPVIGAGFAPGSKFIYTVTEKGKVRAWLNQMLFTTYDTKFNKVTKATLSPDGGLLAIGGEEGLLKMFDASGNLLYEINVADFMNNIGKLPSKITKENTLITHISFNLKGDKVLINTNKGSVLLHFGNKNKENGDWRAKEQLIKDYKGNMLMVEAGGLPSLTYLKQVVLPYFYALSHLELNNKETAYRTVYQIPLEKLKDDALGCRVKVGFALGVMEYQGDGMATLMYEAGLDTLLSIESACKSTFTPALSYDLVKLVDGLNRMYEGAPGTFLEKSCSLQNRIYNNYCNLLKQYEEIGIPSEGYLPFKDKGLWGYLNAQNTMVIPAKYLEASGVTNGMAVVAIPSNKTPIYAIINMQGKIVYDAIGMESEGMLPVRKGNLWGYLDAKFTLRIKPSFSQAGVFKSGLAIAQKSVNGKLLFGYIDFTGKTVIPFQFVTANPFSDNGVAYVTDLKGASYFIDRDGKVVKLQAIGGNVAKPEEAIVDVRAEKSRAVVIQPVNSDSAVKVKMYDFVGEISEGVQRVMTNGKYGFVSASGKPISKATYADAKDFFEGLAAVKTLDKWGFMDKNGVIVIPQVYDEVKRSFNNGLAMVKIDKTSFFIDNKGNCVEQQGYPCPNLIPTAPTADISPIASDIQVFQEGDKWGMKNANNVVIVPPTYKNRPQFVAGVAKGLLPSGKWQYFNRKGKVLTPEGFEDALDFSDGLAAVKKGKKWGYIDLNGKVVIPFIYDRAQSYQNRRAKVTTGEKTYYINTRGGFEAEEAVKEGGNIGIYEGYENNIPIQQMQNIPIAPQENIKNPKPVIKGGGKPNYDMKK